MIKLVLAAGVTLLMADGALAQTYCAQVKLAVATYGYQAARQHALANYGKDAVEAAEKCLSPHDRRSGPHAADAQARPRRG